MPKDQTPLGDEMVERLPERKFPQPKPGIAREETDRGPASADEAADALDIGRRPALPDHPERMPADIPDDGAQPPADTVRGIADADDIKSLKKQRG